VGGTGLPALLAFLGPDRRSASLPGARAAVASGHRRAWGAQATSGAQPLWRVAGKNWDAVHPGVMAEPVAGHADLAATGLEQHLAVEVGPLLDRGFKSGGQVRGPREGDTHEPIQKRTHVLAVARSPRLRCVHIFPGSVVAVRVGIRELRARLASHLETATPIEVTRHGRTVGLYVPPAPGVGSQ